VTKFNAAFVWAGGGLFVGALGFCAYSFAVTWSGAAAFNRAAIAVDALLFSAFALHHSLFARESVKRWLARLVPAALLRSAYVWIASTLLVGVCVAWQPVGGTLYRHAGVLAVVHGAIQVIGVLIIVLAVRTIDALELAGIHPLSGAESLQIVGPYRWVRHPLYSGWLLVTFGAAHMTGDRAIFAAISTFYLLMAMPFEERSLGMSFGAAYEDYKRAVPSRIIPYVY
jgi:protein-S-isoprenylcysteine O-methyltransferase Ste14